MRAAARLARTAIPLGGAAWLADRRQSSASESLGTVGARRRPRTIGKYALGKTLGEGAFATVALARDTESNIPVACKLIRKRSSDADTVAREVAMLERAGAHRHLVTLLDSVELEDEHALFLELVTGGEVFDRIVDRGAYSEADAAGVARQVGSALRRLHGRGIAHRDLKPENLLLVSDAHDADVKVCDFGLACEADREMTGTEGTLAYMAPEMLSGGSYDEAVDLWALGVILYVLLAGFHPFDADGRASPEDLAVRIAGLRWDFDDGAWAAISDDAKALVASLLAGRTARATLADVEASPWVRGATASTAPLPHAERLRAFNDARRTWRAAIRAAALVGRAPLREGRGGGIDAPSPEDVAELRDAFDILDRERNGVLGIAELEAAARLLGAPEADMAAVLAQADTHHDGFVTFAEFCAVVGPICERSTLALRRAFRLFDADGSGTIDRGELEAMLSKLGLAPESGAALDLLFDHADTDRSGGISFDEFVTLFKRKSAAATPPARRASDD